MSAGSSNYDITVASGVTDAVVGGTWAADMTLLSTAVTDWTKAVSLNALCG